MERTLADLLAEYERNPNPNLGRTIELIRAEIELRARFWKAESRKGIPAGGIF
jgi:hypothetical protein